MFDVLRKKRLNHELRAGVSLPQLLDKLIYDQEVYLDNDRLVQAIDIQKDIRIVQDWIDLAKDE